MKGTLEMLVDKSNTSYVNLLFVDLECAAQKFQSKQFESCHFKHCNFDESHWVNCKFTDCEFSDCNFNCAIITNSVFLEVVFDSSKVMGINWTLAKWPQIKLCSPIDFFNCNISHSSFFGLSLTEIHIQSCTVHNADFREADLSYGDLTHSDFYQSIFISTRLFSADFSEAINYNIDLRSNIVKKCIFTFPEAITLLRHFEIEIKGLPEN